MTTRPHGPLCPFGDGRHQLRVWAGGGASGFACVRCHKTWRWDEHELIATYPEPGA